ncbi:MULTISPECIES: hypothetical protein [Aquimarina]|uniref:Uncharacterized protein n=1 Tax=Aquimarina algiphila TaxID=2047982 RepID=A0A554VN11_9FLAO|nr:MULTISPECIES: hypothetical protein [Aquimarina]TSE09727.1 hypothetical protein FOF46_06855 [Aquimarina algiphila]
MGFGGSTAAMITSLKNNSRRKKREAFDGWTSSDKESQGIKTEPVSQETLAKIRKKMRKQNRVNTIKGVIIISISIAITAWLFFRLTYRM